MIKIFIWNMFDISENIEKNVIYFYLYIVLGSAPRAEGLEWLDSLSAR